MAQKIQESLTFFKLMAPLVARMGQRQEQTIWTSLKQLLEEQQVPLP